MPRIPPTKARDVVAAFKRLGWKERKAKGGHKILVKDGCGHLSIPMSRGDVKAGTLHSLVEAAGITVEEFLDAL